MAATPIEPISKFFSALGRYPGNNKQWWVARQAADDVGPPVVKAGDFLPELLDKSYSGNNRAPRGHFVFNAFTKDRSAVSGISDIVPNSSNARPNTIAFFSGRTWFAAGSEVYYSKIISSKVDAGLCYQEADPTAEDISDLIDSDGGQIIIPEANSITKLLPFSNGVFVFATNGVWFISGGDSKFSATGISIDKVSSFGTTFSKSIIQVDDTVYWWSEVGIQALQQSSGQFGPIPGKFGNQNIAEQTIQSFFNNIPDSCKLNAKGIYDPKNNVIQWMYSSVETATNDYDSILNFDVTLQAFYPWKISLIGGGPKVTGMFLDVGVLNSVTSDTVTTGAGTVTANDASSVTVEINQTSFVNKPTNITYTTLVDTNITFSKFENRNFSDWETFNSDGIAYDSYIETGYELNNDAMRKKEAVRVFVFFRRTEDDSLGVPTSCKMRAKWDWSANSNSNKWSTETEAYRPRNIIAATTADLDSGFPVVISNNKVRGNGKAVQFRFGTNEIGRNFDLLGWAVLYAGNTKP